MSALEKKVLYLDPRQVEWLDETKKKTGVPISASIRLALDAYIAAAEREIRKLNAAQAGLSLNE